MLRHQLPRASTPFCLGKRTGDCAFENLRKLRKFREIVVQFFDKTSTYG
jgi:hypothetical protein